MDNPSVDSLCILLAKVKLLTPDQVRTLVAAWRLEADSAEGSKFLPWLVKRGDLTSFQADRLARGATDHYFLQQYKLLERIGQGRMAGIYKAENALGQTVAIKVLPPSRAKDAHALARFQREARLAMKLQHPNVVRALQVGLDQNLHFIVMEYLQGESLGEMLERRGKLPYEEAVSLIHQAFLGLQHIHEQGIIHRDLKPANLMLVPTAIVKIVDVGLGKALFDESPENIDLTSEGAMLGTPNYMAPEQARSAATVDIRADIYSLGCVLFHMLTGQVPFPDSNSVRKMMRHASEIPAAVKTFQVEIPEALQEVLNGMLAKDPALRYATPEKAAQALMPFLNQPGDSGVKDENVGNRKDADEGPQSKKNETSDAPKGASLPTLLDSMPRKAAWVPSYREVVFFIVGMLTMLILGGSAFIRRLTE